MFKSCCKHDILTNDSMHMNLACLINILTGLRNSGICDSVVEVTAFCLKIIFLSCLQ